MSIVHIGSRLIFAGWELLEALPQRLCPAHMANLWPPGVLNLDIDIAIGRSELRLDSTQVSTKAEPKLDSDEWETQYYMGRAIFDPCRPRPETRKPYVVSAALAKIVPGLRHLMKPVDESEPVDESPLINGRGPVDQRKRGRFAIDQGDTNASGVPSTCQWWIDEWERRERRRLTNIGD